MAQGSLGMADDDVDEHYQFNDSGDEATPDSDSYRSPNMELAEQANFRRGA